MQNQENEFDRYGTLENQQTPTGLFCLVNLPQDRETYLALEAENDTASDDSSENATSSDDEEEKPKDKRTTEELQAGYLLKRSKDSLEQHTNEDFEASKNAMTTFSGREGDNKAFANQNLAVSYFTQLVVYFSVFIHVCPAGTHNFYIHFPAISPVHFLLWYLCNNWADLLDAPKSTIVKCLKQAFPKLNTAYLSAAASFIYLWCLAPMMSVSEQAFEGAIVREIFNLNNRGRDMQTAYMHMESIRTALMLLTLALVTLRERDYVAPSATYAALPTTLTDKSFVADLLKHCITFVPVWEHSSLKKMHWNSFSSYFTKHAGGETQARVDSQLKAMEEQCYHRCRLAEKALTDERGREAVEKFVRDTWKRAEEELKLLCTQNATEPDVTTVLAKIVASKTTTDSKTPTNNSTGVVGTFNNPRMLPLRERIEKKELVTAEAIVAALTHEDFFGVGQQRQPELIKAFLAIAGLADANLLVVPASKAQKLNPNRQRDGNRRNNNNKGRNNNANRRNNSNDVFRRNNSNDGFRRNNSQGPNFNRRYDGNNKGNKKFGGPRQNNRRDDEKESGKRRQRSNDRQPSSSSDRSDK